MKKSSELRRSRRFLSVVSIIGLLSVVPSVARADAVPCEDVPGAVEKFECLVDYALGQLGEVNDRVPNLDEAVHEIINNTPGSVFCQAGAGSPSLHSNGYELRYGGLYGCGGEEQDYLHIQACLMRKDGATFTLLEETCREKQRFDQAGIPIQRRFPCTPGWQYYKTIVVGDSADLQDGPNDDWDISTTSEIYCRPSISEPPDVLEVIETATNAVEDVQDTLLD